MNIIVQYGGVLQTKQSLATWTRSDSEPDQGAQRVVDLVHDNEWEEVVGEME